MSTKRRTMRAWCGFENNRPVCAPDDKLLCSAGGDLNQYGEGLFRTRWKASGGYQDVRKVTITWDVPVKRPKARKAKR